MRELFNNILVTKKEVDFTVLPTDSDDYCNTIHFSMDGYNVYIMKTIEHDLSQIVELNSDELKGHLFVINMSDHNSITAMDFNGKEPDVIETDDTFPENICGMFSDLDEDESILCDMLMSLITRPTDIRKILFIYHVEFDEITRDMKLD